MDAISSLGSVFTGGSGGVPTWMKLLLGGLTASGEVGNVMADRQRQAQLNKVNAWENLTPAQLSAKVAQATKPLDAGLTQGVGNVVQADLGERGLSQAPGIQAATLSQALAPYYQQNQNVALQQVLQQMMLPATAASMVAQPQNLSPMLALLLASMKGGQNPSNPGITTNNIDWSAVPDINPTFPSNADATAGNVVQALG